MYFLRMLHTEGTVVNRKYQFTADYNGVTLTLMSDEYRVFREFIINYNLPNAQYKYPVELPLFMYIRGRSNVTLANLRKIIIFVL